MLHIYNTHMRWLCEEFSNTETLFLSVFIFTLESKPTPTSDAVARSCCAVLKVPLCRCVLSILLSISIRATNMYIDCCVATYKLLLVPLLFLNSVFNLFLLQSIFIDSVVVVVVAVSLVETWVECKLQLLRFIACCSYERSYKEETKIERGGGRDT